MLKYKTGDLVKLASDGEFDVIAHGCNCFNTMGAGIAKRLAAKFPEIIDADNKTLHGDPSKLGNWSIAHVNNDKLGILNLYTQYRYGTDQIHFNYAALKLIFDKLVLCYDDELCEGLRIGLPLIGCGLAGGNPAHVVPLMNFFSKKVAKNNISVTLVTLEPIESILPK